MLLTSPAGGRSLNHAYIDPQTGNIFYVSDEMDLKDEFGEEIPDDFETSDRFIAIPARNDLDLGLELVQAFVDETIPEHEATIREFFRHSGAYGRFKHFLETKGLLQAWYDYENRETEATVRGWAADENIALIED